MRKSKLDSLIFIEADAHADSLEQAVASAATGDNLVYARSVLDLNGRKQIAAKALDLAERGLVSLVTMKIGKNPPLYHYIAQRSKRAYTKKGSGK